MARRRRKRVNLGQPVGIRRLRQGGYPKRNADGTYSLIGYQDNKEITLARGHKVGCTKIRPGAPGSWISSERCSYQFKFTDAGKGAWYSCRGYGEGMAASCRRMKSPPRDVKRSTRYG